MYDPEVRMAPVTILDTGYEDSEELDENGKTKLAAPFDPLESSEEEQEQEEEKDPIRPSQVFLVSSQEIF